MRKTTAARTEVSHSRVRRKSGSLAKRRLWFRFQLCLWCVLLPPLGLLYLSRWLHRYSLRPFIKARYGRITIADIGFYTKDMKDETAFASATVEALRLIETHDPRRFRTIQRELAYIFNAVLLSAGDYHRPLRACRCDFSRYYFDKQHEHYEWWLAYHAGLIIHEATHGRLASLYFPYTKATRLRIERICHAEQCRFVARLPSERYDFARDLVSPFDETRWHPSWNRSRWQDVTAQIRRLRESRDAAADAKTAD